MQSVTYLKKPLYFLSHASVGGKEEGRGPLGDSFDLIDESDLFGMKTFERAEGEMSRLALNLALKKANIDPKNLSLIVSGDLQNQCVASSGGLFSFGAPYLGLYGACSTCTESLLVLCSMMSCSERYSFGAAVTSSHNSAAERQFRMPIEYGGQRAPSSQWTATASGAFLVSKTPTRAKITAFMPGKIVDGYTSEQSNMGAAMALSAKDTLLKFFEEEDPYSYDLILTGDLGEVGSSILHEVLQSESRHGSRISSVHQDCGLMLFDKKSQDVHAGASGCGCSASVLSSFILPKVERGEIKKMLLLSTGALMSTGSVNQGEHILGIAPLLRIESNDIF